jgi:hypothetical protein
MGNKSAALPFKYLNVIMHGVYGYDWNPKETTLRALTPAVCRHVYCARNYGATLPQKGSVAHSIPLLGDYILTGVSRRKAFKLSAGTPRLPAKQSCITRCDHYGKRLFCVDLPYPTGDGLVGSQTYYLLESFNVGSIYQGTAAAPLNAVGMSFPSLFCFVYKVNPKETLALVPKTTQPAIRAKQPPPQTIKLDFLLPRGDYANLHIMGGLDPEVNMPHMADHAPHARRAFASLIDMFDELPLTLEIPDGFAPQRMDYTLPTGVRTADIEQNGIHPSLHYGRANCHSATFVIDHS